MEKIRKKKKYHRIKKLPLKNLLHEKLDKQVINMLRKKLEFRETRYLLVTVN